MPTRIFLRAIGERSRERLIDRPLDQKRREASERNCPVDRKALWTATDQRALEIGVGEDDIGRFAPHSNEQRFKVRRLRGAA